MNVAEFHPDAKEELLRNVHYYEQCRVGLGLDFARQVHDAIRGLTIHPTMWPKLDGDIRRCLINRFPFGILYHVEADRIHILAVMPLRRDPEYWKERIESDE
ncbi:type II toxin-antitoxin system RelE/ParE family toxin [bacterium]|nr:type II toxin-antitoxin system RelE/ParE family toxin [bacterium]